MLKASIAERARIFCHLSICLYFPALLPIFGFATSLHVVELTPINYMAQMSSSTNFLISYSVPWCPHCKRVAPIFDQLASEMAELNDRAVDLGELQPHEFDRSYEEDETSATTAGRGPLSTEHVALFETLTARYFIQSDDGEVKPSPHAPSHTTLTEDSRQLNKLIIWLLRKTGERVSLASVNCEQHGAVLCEDVEGYPSFFWSGGSLIDESGHRQHVMEFVGHTGTG